MAEINTPGLNTEQIQALMPQPSSAVPPGVSDMGSVGTQTTTYALANHTHASKARKQIVTMGSAASTYTWVYPNPFAAGVSPVVSAIVQVSAGNTDLFNVQIQGVATNTQCTFQINRVSGGLLSLLLGALSLNPTPVASTLHMIALEP